MNDYYCDKIEKLRTVATHPHFQESPQFDFTAMYYSFFKKYAVNEAEGSRERRYADAFYTAMSEAVPPIGEDELIVGKPVHPLPLEKAAEWESLKPLVNSFVSMGGQDSHMTVDYALLLEKGVTGVISVIEGYEKETDDAEKKDFYYCCRRCLEGTVVLSRRYADEAERLAGKCNDEVRKKELLKIAEVCRNVPEKPAKTFYEAVQSVCFMTYCISYEPSRAWGMMQFQLGRPDRYLLPYYEKDMADGTLDKDLAQALIDCMAIMINHRVARGLSSGYMVGGRDASGKTVANDITMMCLQAIDDVRLVYPAVGLCYTKDMPEIFLDKACEILSHGRSHPAIFNDDLISSGLKSYGVPEEEAHDYIHSTCVEITPISSSSIWVASPYTNMPQILLDIMDREYDSMDSLWERYFERLDVLIGEHLENERATRRIRARDGIHPLLSCFVNDCLKNGKDIDRGGARYNWIMPSFVGIANLTDCMNAIKTVIFEKHEMTFAQLKALLDKNFEGAEDVRQRLLNGIEKYGNNDPETDAVFGKITSHISAECEKYHDPETGFNLVPSAFCWIMHEIFGRETGATPDGRVAGFPLGDGSGACQGREKKGPTSSLISATSWSHGRFIGGVAVNLKFSKKIFTNDSFSKVKTLIKTYIARGGFELQVNVVDRDTLIDAQKNPELHRDLVVRIGGYSDYFVCLSPEMQAEVLQRTEHGL